MAYKNPYSSTLIQSKNIILRGAPGTGKSYLAKGIAADIISNGEFTEFEKLSDEQKKQVEFVQFHPSYDYTDFVEGLKPVINDDGTMGFELKDGIFKNFADIARKNYEDSRKSDETIRKENSITEALSNFLSEIKLGENTYTTKTGNQFTIENYNEKNIVVSIPNNKTVKKLVLNVSNIVKMLESGKEFKKVNEVKRFFGKTYATQAYSYDFALYQEIKKIIKTSKIEIIKEQERKYIFIIDEINRGEISKIFGELFFSIDPGYRGEKGEISTQYSSLHDDPSYKFYIPENLYIIGTMNDIDRSVDSFDFAMRRRFRFIEIKADENVEMLKALDDREDEAIKRMKALNAKIKDTPDLNENYQIGAAYFLKLADGISFNQLWEDYLKPLLEEYIRGMNDEEEIMKKIPFCTVLVP